MSVYQYFMEEHYDKNGLKYRTFWKMNKTFMLGTAEKGSKEPWLTVNISRGEDFQKFWPVSSEDIKVKRVTEEAYTMHYNETLAALQKLRFHDGEYYNQKDEDGTSIRFYGFFRSPSRYNSIEYIQNAGYIELMLSTERTLLPRRGIANRSKIFNEYAFAEAFKRTLEFFFDGTAMIANYEKLWDILDTLNGSDEPSEPPLINDQYYYLRARDLMLKRKEQLKARLLDFDDVPSRRREIRAEMKGLDYCVSILEKNH